MIDRKLSFLFRTFEVGVFCDECTCMLKHRDIPFWNSASISPNIPIYEWLFPPNIPIYVVDWIAQYIIVFIQYNSVLIIWYLSFGIKLY